MTGEYGEPHTNLSTALSVLNQSRSEWPPNVWHFTYLRGIDDLLPGQSPPKAEPGNEKTRAQQIEELERPEGQNRLDYIPRLGSEPFSIAYSLGG